MFFVNILEVSHTLHSTRTRLVNHYVLFYLSRARPWYFLNTNDCDQPVKKYMYSSGILQTCIRLLIKCQQGFSRVYMSSISCNSKISLLQQITFPIFRRILFYLKMYQENISAGALILSY